MFPEVILNCMAFTALVVLPYPSVKKFPELSLCLAILISEIKCLTKVVELGLNNVNVPEIVWSLSFPTPSANILNAVDCAKS
jgi:hypothetical protein